MSENEQQNVSRETARTPIEARRSGSAGDPPEDVSRETSVPLKKGKGSSFFISSSATATPPWTISA